MKTREIFSLATCVIYTGKGWMNRWKQAQNFGANFLRTPQTLPIPTRVCACAHVCFEV